MKTETLYVSDDGKYFQTKEDCELYEENSKREKANKNMRAAVAKYDRANREIQRLKAFWAPSEYWDNPTPEYIEACTNLPRIERMCAKAKEAYIKAVTAPGRIKRMWRVKAVAEAAAIYWQAIVHRRALMDELVKARIDRRNATERIKAIKRAQGGWIPEVKPDIEK